jgi:hypothetical protein
MVEIMFPLIPNDVLDNLTFWVLAFTLLVAGIYTFLAARQISEMVRLRRLSLLPKLTARMKATDNPFGGAALNLTNVGNGTAVNVSVEFPIIHWDDRTTVRVWCYPFQSILPATKSESNSAEMEIHLGESDGSQESMESISVSGLLGRFAGPDVFFDRFTLRLTFEDISGTKYTQDITLDDDIRTGEFRYYTYALGSVRRYGLWQSLLDTMKPRVTSELRRQWRWHRNKFRVRPSATQN